jgi:hypothetical protein
MASCPRALDADLRFRRLRARQSVAADREPKTFAPVVARSAAMSST